MTPPVSQSVHDNSSDSSAAAPAEVTFPTSFAQRQLWVIESMSPGRATYNIPLALELRGALDVAALTGALRQLVARHEALRTRFRLVEGVPVQVIGAARAFELPPIAVADEAELARALAEEARRPFDLERGPLFRASLYRVSDAHHALLLNVHHSCADAWSLGILLRELAAGYAGASELPPLALQYGDYAEWQHEHLGGAIADGVAYWRDVLREPPPALELPTSRAAAAEPTGRGGAHYFRLGDELGSKLAALCTREQLTPFMALLAAFQSVMSRASGARDVAVGTPVANRTRRESEDIVGMFANALVMRTSFADDPSFRQVALRVRQALLEAHPHAEVPFAHLVEQLAPGRLAGRNPLFQVAFGYRSTPLTAPSLPGLQVSCREVDTGSAKFDLTLEVWPDAGGYGCRLEYATDRFADDDAARLARWYAAFLDAATAHPEQAVSELPLLAADERELVVSTWNRTAQTYSGGATLHALIEAQIQATPARIALQFGAQELTYAQLGERALRLAYRLHGAGVGPEGLAAVCLPRGLDLVPALLAVIAAGGAYVPLDPDSPDERLAEMLADAAPAVVITTRALAPRLAGARAPLLLIDEVDGQAGGELAAWRAVDPDQSVYAIYTSGSTGKPKAAINTHRGVVNRLQWMQATYRLGQDDRVLQKTPIGFDVSVWELFWPLIAGARLVLAEPGGHRDPRYLVELIQRAGITTAHFVPSMLRAFVAEPGVAECTSLRRVICSGEALTPELRQRWFAASGAELHNLYGPTEASIDVSWWACERGDASAPVPIGRPIANTQLYVLSAQLEPVPPGMIGELYIGGVALGRGYLGRAAMTAERFVPSPFGDGARLYRTGDLARLRSDGAIEFLGRCDDQVKIRGHRVELGEIESALLAHPAVEAAAVVASGAPGDVSLIAYVVPRADHAGAARRLAALERRGELAGFEWAELPNGMPVVQRNRGETEFTYREIFQQREYLRHGLELTPGACVIDVGANIGLFSMFVVEHCPGARVFALEPVPEVFGALRRNAEIHGPGIQPLPYGLAERAGSATFTYYPHLSIMSGISADEADREVVRSYAAQQGAAPGTLLDELVDERMAAQQVTCELSTLSAMMREHAIEYVDLLKIDVEKSELAVLAGIAGDDWARIRQVVVEVHDHEGRLRQVVDLLERRGFVTAVEPSPAGRALFLVYARRGASVTSAAARGGLHAAGPAHFEAALRTALAARLPDAMVPATFVVLDQLPLSSSGKLDRKALPPPPAQRRRAAKVPPRTPLETALAQLFSEVLGVPEVGVTEDFFTLGGHSLLAVQVVARARVELGLELPVWRLFAARTVEQLAAACEASAAPARPSGIARTHGDAPSPLSPQQHGLWLAAEMGGAHAAAYNIPVVRRLRGPVDLAALRAALADVVQRQSALRSSFQVGDDGEVRQVVHDLELAVRDVDLRRAAAATKSVQLSQLLGRLVDQPFDVRRAPLVRCALIRLEDEELVLVLVAHHLVFDAWSIRVLFEELSARYRAHAAGAPATQPPLPVHYGDYARYAAERLDAQTVADSVAYWSEALAGAPQLLAVPTDRPRPAAQSFRGATMALALEAETVARLDELCRTERATLYAALLAGFQLLLHRWSRQDDVVVGSSVADRELAETQALIGYFVKTVALRARFGERPSYRELLAQVREATQAALTHAEVPFSRVVSELGVARDPSYNPVFQAFFALQPEGLEALDLPGVRVDALPHGGSGATFDLVLSFERAGAELRGVLEYDSALFDEATAIRLCARYRTLMARVVAAPDAPVASFELDAALPAAAPSRLAQLPERLPASAHQERIWLVDQFETTVLYAESPPYHNVPLILELTGAVELPRMQRALDAVLARHHVLRTRFESAAGAAMQVVTEARVPIALLEGGSREALLEAAVQESQRPFSARVGSAVLLKEAELPVRAALLRGPDAAVFVLTVQHLLVDRGSMQLVARELAAAYRGELDGAAPLQWSEYATWQREQPSAAIEPHLFYWRYQLRGKLQELVLPASRPRPPVQTFTARRCQRGLGQQLSADLARLAAAHGTSIRAVLLAGFAAAVHRHARQDEIMLGTSVPLGQQLAPGMVGPAANLVALRCDVGGNPTYLELLRRSDELLAGAWRHGAMQFDALVRALDPEKDMTRTALFDVLFEVEEAPELSFDFGGARARVRDTNLGYGKYDLHLLAQPEDGELRFHAVYNLDIFDLPQIDRLLEHTAQLLAEMARDPGQRVGDAALVGAATPRPTSAPADLATIPQLFERSAAQHPDRVAVTFGSKVLTYAQLERRANQLAHELVARGVVPDQLVAICIDRNDELIVGLLAILKAGGAYVPLDPSYPAERLEYMMKDSAVAHVVTTERLIGRLPAGARPVLIDAEAAQIAAHPSTPPAVSLGAEHVAYCIYTSGSTGQPKGTLIEHRQVTQLMEQGRQLFKIDERDVWTMFHSPCFDFSVWEIWGALLFGGRLVMVPYYVSRSPGAFYELLRDERVTVLNQTPSAFRQLMAAEQEIDARSGELALRLVVFGGEALMPRALLPWFERHGDDAPQLINMYGITETTVHVTWRRVRKADAERDHRSLIGPPIPGVGLIVVDAYGHEAPIGVPGELWVSGSGVCRGYLRRPELTAARFVTRPDGGADRYYRSGDLGRRTEEGDLEYLGRIDTQIQLRGFRIELGEIEAVALEDKAVGACAVNLHRDEEGVEQLVAYLVAAHGRSIDIKATREHIRMRLPEYMVPNAFVVLPVLPLTSNGKLDREALPAPQASREAAAAAYVTPSLGDEAALAHIWREVLGIEDIGAEDNFFDVGGHSMLLARVQSRIASDLSKQVAIVDLFRHPTIKAMSAFLSQPSSGAGNRAASSACDDSGREAQRQREQRQRRLAQRTGKATI